MDALILPVLGLRHTHALALIIYAVSPRRGFDESVLATGRRCSPSLHYDAWPAPTHHTWVPQMTRRLDTENGG